MSCIVADSGPSGMGRWTSAAVLAAAALAQPSGISAWTAGNSLNLVPDATSVAVSYDGTVAYAAAEAYASSGSVLKSIDSGATWASLPNSCASVGGVACSADGSIVVSTTYLGTICLSSDGGDTWATADPANEGGVGFYGTPAVSQSGSVIAVSSYGFLFISTDGGVSWGSGDSAQMMWAGMAISADGKYMVSRTPNYIILSRHIVV